MNRSGGWVVVASTLGILVALSANAPAQSTQEQIEALADEIARLREQMAIPETDAELRSAYGMGPAASKVYQVRQGVSLGGYGEFYYAGPLEDTDQTGAVATGDYYRFITYFGYKFSDRIVMNTEIEFEHATTSSNFEGDAGSVSVEFSYLDFLLQDEINVRAGNLLVPVGIVNTIHEPSFYRGNFRPEIESRIIPSTWRELGAGIHGKLGDAGPRYTAYVVNGMNGAKFDDKGVRGGRQKGNRVLFEDVGGVVAAQYEHGRRFVVGASFYAGGADHDQIRADENSPAIDVSHWIWEAHAIVREGPFEGRALFAQSHIDGAAELTPIVFPATDPKVAGKLVPSDQVGWYVEGAVDLAPYLLGEDSSWQLSPWVRFESFDLQDAVPQVDGRSASANLDVQSVTVGIDAKPHPNVVLKLDYVHTTNEADAPTSDELRVGAGFVY